MEIVLEWFRRGFPIERYFFRTFSQMLVEQFMTNKIKPLRVVNLFNIK